MLVRRVLPLLLIVLMLGVLFAAALAAASALPVQDLAQYWAAAHLVTKNPYSLELTTSFERSAGVVSVAPPLVTKIPPSAIMLVLPLGFLGYKAAFALWSVMSIVVIAGCARAVWDLFTPTPSLAPALLSLLFGPTVVILMLGQLTVLVLLGITLFLILAARKRDWLAGASLLLVVAKPHVVFLFLLAVLLWILYSKRWKILVSGTVAFSAATVAAIAINPHIYAQFMDRTRLVVHETESYPNLGGALYAASGHHVLALVPQLIGLIWLAFYWRKHRVEWDWKSDGMIVLLVSVATSYYSYPYDEVLVLPALLAAFANGKNRRMFLVGLLATNLGYALYISNVAGHFKLGYMFLWWPASAWLVTYVLSQHPRTRLAPAY